MLNVFVFVRGPCRGEQVKFIDDARTFVRVRTKRSKRVSIRATLTHHGAADDRSQYFTVVLRAWLFGTCLSVKKNRPIDLARRLRCACRKCFIVTCNTGSRPRRTYQGKRKRFELR